MNNDKNLKRQKLRNNEYYNSQQTHDELYARSEKGATFNKLMELIVSNENILLAYRNIKRNTGSRTKGTDGKTIQHLAKMTPEELITLIKHKLQNYQPQKVRRVEIPKNDGKMRPLGIPTISDRLIQQCILQILEPICEAKFYKYSYGFRPLRSAKHAITRAYHSAQQAQLHYVIDIDIKGFFDNINHGKLLKQIWSLGIRDKQLICIISKLLKAEVEGIGKQTKGTPQGGIISPLLANITLNELDWWIASQWAEMPTRKKYKGNAEDAYCNRLKALKKSNLKEVYIVRYADDFKIFCRNLNSAKRMYIAVRQWLKERLQLDVNEEKSGIINLKKNYSEFLGIKFKVHKKGKKHNKNRMVVKSLIGNKSKETISKTIKKRILEIQRPKDHNVQKAVNALNAYILGVHNYFNAATHCSFDFGKIGYVANRIIKNRLNPRKRRKNDRIPQYILDKYGKSTLIKMYCDMALIPVSYVQHHRLMNFNGITPYKAEDREKMHQNQQAVDTWILKYLMESINTKESAEFNDNRISLFVGQYGKCYVLEELLTPDNIHCHHKEPKANGGTDEYKNLVVLHHDIHKLVHTTCNKTIQQYLGELHLDAEQMGKLNKLRKLAEMPEI